MAMTDDDYKLFTCIVAGDNPDELMSEYDKNKGELKIIYKRSDKAKVRETFIKLYESKLRNLSENDDIWAQVEYYKMELADAAEMDDDEFFAHLIERYQFVEDEDGNACAYGNENGKWSYYTIGKLFSLPFLLKDGREVFQARKGDVDWEQIHLHGGYAYARIWEMVMEKSEPRDDKEKHVFEAMQDKTFYLEKFETKENYITSNTAFWAFAFLSDKTGWMDGSFDDQFAWMSNFYDVFIKNLPDDTLLTIYECKV